MVSSWLLEEGKSHLCFLRKVRNHCPYIFSFGILIKTYITLWKHFLIYSFSLCSKYQSSEVIVRILHIKFTYFAIYLCKNNQEGKYYVKTHLLIHEFIFNSRIASWEYNDNTCSKSLHWRGYFSSLRLYYKTYNYACLSK